jgi:hypothetical protein
MKLKRSMALALCFMFAVTAGCQNGENIESENSNSAKETTIVGNAVEANAAGIITESQMSSGQKLVASFFDGGGFYNLKAELLIKLADTCKGINVCYSSHVTVDKILDVNDSTFEATILLTNFEGGVYLSEKEAAEHKVLIKGDKPSSMIQSGDVIYLRGKLEGTEVKEIDGKSEYMPVIQCESIASGSEHLFTDTEIRTIAKEMFGQDIKVRRPTFEETDKMVTQSVFTYSDYIYLVEMEDQSNLNFKMFDIWQDYGAMTYDPIYNQGVEKDYLNKKICISPDLNYYIVFDYSRNDKYLYLSVYDKNRTKQWSKEISNITNITWNATTKELAVVSDNDLYVFDIATGENLFDPVMVDERVSVTITQNGYLLGGCDTNDAIVFVSREGKIVNKSDISSLSSQSKNIACYVQELNGNYVMEFAYQGSSVWVLCDSQGNQLEVIKS